MQCIPDQWPGLGSKNHTQSVVGRPCLGWLDQVADVTTHRGGSLFWLVDAESARGAARHMTAKKTAPAGLLAPVDRRPAGPGGPLPP